MHKDTLALRSSAILFLVPLIAALTACAPVAPGTDTTREDGAAGAIEEPEEAKMPVSAPGAEDVEEMRVVDEVGASAKLIEMEADNFYFEPDTMSVKRGQAVRIEYEVEQGVHTFDIDELNVHVALQGTESEIVFTPDRTGTFPFYCASPGHRERGMVGTLVVTE